MYLIEWHNHLFALLWAIVGSSKLLKNKIYAKSNCNLHIKRVDCPQTISSRGRVNLIAKYAGR